jgi:hypothetical protein
MVIFKKVNLKMEKKKELVFLLGMIIQFILENGKMII